MNNSVLVTFLKLQFLQWRISGLLILRTKLGYLENDFMILCIARMNHLIKISHWPHIKPKIQLSLLPSPVIEDIHPSKIEDGVYVLAKVESEKNVHYTYAGVAKSSVDEESDVLIMLLKTAVDDGRRLFKLVENDLSDILSRIWWKSNRLLKLLKKKIIYRVTASIREIRLIEEWWLFKFLCFWNSYLFQSS